MKWREIRSPVTSPVTSARKHRIVTDIEILLDWSEGVPATTSTSGVTVAAGVTVTSSGMIFVSRNTSTSAVTVAAGVTVTSSGMIFVSRNTSKMKQDHGNTCYVVILYEIHVPRITF